MKFYKYQGSGNDFIIIDNIRGEITEKDKKAVAQKLCHRNFGVGADGLILIEPSSESDARMEIFNPDGSQAEMCGNGIRCLGLHLYRSGSKKEKLLIETVAGLKELILTTEGGEVKYLSVDMGTPGDIKVNQKIRVDDEELEYQFMDIGVPHVVIFSTNIDGVDMARISPKIRYNPIFPRGTNVNFVQKIEEGKFKIRTYERGVERETMACGTGITASGIVSFHLGFVGEGKEMEFQAKGGTVFVTAKREDSVIRAFLRGPAEFVFEGEISTYF